MGRAPTHNACFMSASCGSVLLVNSSTHSSHSTHYTAPPLGHRSFFHWLFRGSRQPFEIVVLDHGTYLTLTPELREQYCQLWCSFAACDVQV